MLEFSAAMGRVRRHFREKVEDWVTLPLGKPEHLEDFDYGRKIPYHTFIGMLCMCCQDERLTVEETEYLKHLLLTEK